MEMDQYLAHAQQGYMPAEHFEPDEEEVVDEAEEEDEEEEEEEEETEVKMEEDNALEPDTEFKATCCHSIVELGTSIFLNCAFPKPRKALDNKNLSFSRLTICCKHFDADHIAFIQKLKFKELRLYDLKNTRFVRNLNFGSNTDLKLDIAQFLGILISSPNRQNLRYLTIDGNGLKFNDGWPREIAKLFPSIKILRIQRYNHLQVAFEDICSSFPNLFPLIFPGALLQV
uniref:F-box/LRR-repeat protein n=2 Tax=Caenorhabditis tropicalis TaxID=1561998 RepID=A0A1I7U069_9PELO